MKFNKLPKALRRNTEGFKFEAYKVYLVYLTSFTTTTDGFIGVNMLEYESEKSDNINTQSDIVQSNYLRVPIVSFDGYNVLMLENCCPDVIEKLNNKQKWYTKDYLQDSNKYVWINAFSFDSIDTNELTEEGIKQYNSACIALELYESIIKNKPKRTVEQFRLDLALEESKPTIRVSW
jgi:hypothetical protein